MRLLRLCLGFVVGLVLGASVTFAYAQQLNGPARYGSSIRFNYPDGINAPRRTGGPIYDFPDAPDGWGKMRDINKIKMGSHTFDVHGVRKFSPGTLAKVGAGFARVAGPVGIGITLGELVWDEAQGWLKPAPDNTDPVPGVYYWHTSYGPCNTPQAKCTFDQTTANIDASLTTYVYDSVELINWTTQTVHAWFRSISPPFAKVTIYIRFGGSAPVEETRPATDQELEDAIYVELVSRGMGSDLARRLIEAGYTPTPDGHEADGPTSIPGDTTTTTTSGSAGTTTTTTNTTNNLTYNTNTTTNTTTITVTQTTTTTTTAPDGGTTVSESTKAPTPGATPEAPPEEPTPFCEQYPDASACKPLDVPPSDPVAPHEIPVTFSPSGGFGSEGGSCPAPHGFIVQGRSYQISYDQACSFFAAVRPVVVAVAFFSALLIALGGYKRD